MIEHPAARPCALLSCALTLFNLPLEDRHECSPGAKKKEKDWLHLTEVSHGQTAEGKSEHSNRPARFEATVNCRETGAINKQEPKSHCRKRE
jgi:hypothetical protein